MGVIGKIRRWWRRGPSSNRVLARSAFCDEGGVSQVDWLGDQEVQHRIVWGDIATVIAFKIDLYAYDEIWIALVNDRGDVLACVSEESGSFSLFVQELPRWLDGCKTPDQWWDEVAIPAFRANKTMLYQRCAPDQSRMA